MMGLAEAIGSYALTKRMSRAGLARDQFDAWQTAALDRWLRRKLPLVDYYAGYRGAGLADLPVTEKSLIMGQFDRFNRVGMTTQQVSDAMRAGTNPRGYVVGASSGTSGNRGYFVVTKRETFRWLGAILAKTMGDLLWRRQRVALLLPQSAGLYGSARATGRIDLRAFDVTQDPARWTRDLVSFAPNVIVATPKILRHLAERHVALRPTRVFSASETLDPMDRPIIETHFATPLRQIYMASEGLLAVTCSHGSLHLAEESIMFEFEHVSGGLVTPLITSFRRDTQILARYRMNDLLRLSGHSCSCGSPLRVVDEVVGRVDDILHLDTPSGPRLLTPDVIRNTLSGAHGDVTDFRVIQHEDNRIDLILPSNLCNRAAKEATAAMRNLLNSRGCDASLNVNRRTLNLDPTRKLRRVERRLPPAS